MTRISQREARRLRKRVRALEGAERSMREGWASDWPGGVQIASAQWGENDKVPVAIRTARALRHAVVALSDSSGLVSFHAIMVKETPV